ncbi:ribonuclease E activity regulator RraA [Variovorax robiniae]|uniref:4-hydroxy-4-methyl-2-oxoglutarate aldolase n=1 Tax=Variovorax robiniae TaxID=1836199 RepID=A0ABU8X5K5_9BURK
MATPNAFATADLCDRFGDEAQVCRAPLRPWGGRSEAAGTIACLRTFEDAALVRAQLATPGEGRILVVDGGASERVAILGDHMARLAIQNGWQGLVINGAVRDVGKLASMDLALWALGSVPVRGGGSGIGECDIEVRFGGAVFTPGSFICLDRDGVVVLPKAAQGASTLSPSAERNQANVESSSRPCSSAVMAR